VHFHYDKIQAILLYVTCLILLLQGLFKNMSKMPMIMKWHLLDLLVKHANLTINHVIFIDSCYYGTKIANQIVLHKVQIDTRNKLKLSHL